MVKGRGTSGNPEGRFARDTREQVDDGWEHWDEPLPPLATTVQAEHARSIISRNDSPDIPFEQSINPYRGCETGCSYCYARPSHAYMDLSPGLDFETRLFYKAGAANLLQEALRKPGYRCTPIAFGTNTDPYQPIEKKLRVTRSLIEVLAACHHPLTIVTKHTMVLRDLDLLSDLATQELVRVFVSVTSLDAGLKRTLEPRAASPQARLSAVRSLADAGVPVGVMIAPVIPAVTDSELESIVAAAADAGATSVAWQMLRLPFEVSALFRTWLEEHLPDRAGHVMSLMQQIRGGRDNDPRFGHRMRGDGAFAALIDHRFRVALRKVGLQASGRHRLRTDLFRPPARAGDQGSLF